MYQSYPLQPELSKISSILQDLTQAIFESLHLATAILNLRVLLHYVQRQHVDGHDKLSINMSILQSEAMHHGPIGGLNDA